jgi:hypothetical protein
LRTTVASALIGDISLSFFSSPSAFLTGLLGHARRHDALLQLLDVGTLFAVTEFLLDGLDLLVQVVLALALLHLPLDATTDALLDLQDVHLVLKQFKQLLEPLGDVGEVQHGLLGLQLQLQVRGHGVGQAPRFVDAGDGGEDLGRDLAVELDVLVEVLNHGATQRFDLRSRRRVGADGQHLGDEVLALLPHLAGMRTLQALDQHLHGAVGQLEHLQDGRDAADVKEVLGLGLVLGGGLLGHQHDLPARLHGRLERLDGFGSPDEQRDDHMRKHHHIAQGQQRHLEGFGGKQGVS